MKMTYVNDNFIYKIRILDIVEPTPVATLTDAEVILRRTQSFENDDK